MASNLMVEYCISHLKSRGEDGRAGRLKLVNLRQKNLDDLLEKFADLKKALSVSENRLIAELTSAYDVKIDRYDACLAKISDRINEVRASNKIDTSEVEMPAPWRRRYFVKRLEAKHAIQAMKLWSKTDEMGLETNIPATRVDDKFNVGGLPAPQPTHQSQPNQINVHVTLSTNNSTTVTKQARRDDAVISNPKEKTTKRPAAKSLSTIQSNVDDGDDDDDDGTQLLKRKLVDKISVKSAKKFIPSSESSDDERKITASLAKKRRLKKLVEEDQSIQISSIAKKIVETVWTSESAVPASTGKKEQLSKLRNNVVCEKCAKTRCVYSENFLTESERASWEDYIRNPDTLPYYCGSKLFPKGHFLRKVMWVEKDLKSCKSEINPHYYGVRIARKWPLLCYKCGGLHHIKAISAKDLKEWVSIDPVCSQCILWKKVQGPRKRRRRGQK